MRMKRLLGTVLTLGMLLTSVTIPNSAFAAEKIETVNLETPKQAVEIAPTVKMKKIESNFQKLIMKSKLSVSAIKPSVKVKNLQSTTGDGFEPNNMPNTATSGLKGQMISANIHDGDDVDWYSFTVTSDEVSNNEIYSFILTDIPENCNYDMYVLDSTLSSGLWDLKEGNASEQMLFSFNAAGTYYVMVRSSSGYSNSNYRLYFGHCYLNGSTGWADSGASFNFADKQIGTDGYVYSSPQLHVLDLSSNAAFPLGSIVKRFYLDSQHTGTWGGFEKCLIAASDSNNEHWVLGGIDVFDFTGENYLVKQQWGIRGRVNYCSSFVWTPRVSVDFKYPMILQNLSYAGQ